VRSLASLNNADKRRRDQPDGVVSGERRIDCRCPANAHKRPKLTHPAGGAVTGQLRDVSRTPTFRSGRCHPNPRTEEVGDALDDLLLAHLDLDHGIRRPEAPVADERALTFEETREPRAVTGFPGFTLRR